MRQLFLLTTICLLAACGDAPPTDEPQSGGHHHEAPHGGALIALGDHFAHLELVLDEETGKLTAYIFDGEAENSIRIEQPNIQLKVRIGEMDEAGLPGEVTIDLKASAVTLTGETLGDTSQFDSDQSPAQHFELHGYDQPFTGVIESITVKGRTFENVSFRYPDGNETDGRQDNHDDEDEHTNSNANATNESNGPAPGALLIGEAPEDVNANNNPSVIRDGDRQITFPGQPGAISVDEFNELEAEGDRLAAQTPRTVPGFESIPFELLCNFPYFTDFELDYPYEPRPGEPQPRFEVPQGEEVKRGDDQIPDRVKALSGKAITLQGFMIPLDFTDGGTNHFLFVRVVPRCFYCRPVLANEWIEVKTANDTRVPYNGDDLLLVSGRFEVGTVKDEDDFVSSVYRLTAEKVQTADY